MHLLTTTTVTHFNLLCRNDDQNDGSDLSVLIDQKTYLEEVNRTLRWVL